MLLSLSSGKVQNQGPTRVDRNRFMKHFIGESNQKDKLLTNIWMIQKKTYC